MLVVCALAHAVFMVQVLLLLLLVLLLQLLISLLQQTSQLLPLQQQLLLQLLLMQKEVIVFELDRCVNERQRDATRLWWFNVWGCTCWCAGCKGMAGAVCSLPWDCILGGRHEHRRRHGRHRHLLCKCSVMNWRYTSTCQSIALWQTNRRMCAVAVA